jgi:hypothetical protein
MMLHAQALETRPATSFRPGKIGRMLLLLALLAGGTLAAGEVLPRTDEAAPVTIDGLTMTADGVVVPSEPVEGLLTITIPPGTADLQAEGKPGYLMPSVIRLTVGDTITIVNNDTDPHIMLYGFLPPGGTDTRTFTTPGSEVYSSGCSPSAGEFNDFTTILISE